MTIDVRSVYRSGPLHNSKLVVGLQVGEYTIISGAIMKAKATIIDP